VAKLTLARLVILLVLVAPTWLGPAMTPLVQALGGVAEHHCLCGMKRGECGCPECEALEHARAHDRAGLPGIRTTCDSDGVAATGAAVGAFLPTGRLVVATATPTSDVAPSRATDPTFIQRSAPPPRQIRA